MLDLIRSTADLRPLACYILYQNGLCLMESRPDLNRIGLDPYWVYPGGKVEPNELANEASSRECFEELGVRPHGLYMLEPVTGPNGWLAIPHVYVYWEGDIPKNTLDHRQSPLNWLPPYKMMGQPDNSTCVREIANQIARRIDEIHTLYCQWRVIMGSL